VTETAKPKPLWWRVGKGKWHEDPLLTKRGRAAVREVPGGEGGEGEGQVTDEINWVVSSCSTAVDFDNATISWTPIGTPITDIGNLSAIEFGLDYPPLYRARTRLGIPWRVFRRDWNRLAQGVLDKRATKAARRVLRHSGACLCTEEWDGSSILITPV